MQTSQLALWRSDFGRDYTDRNDYEKLARIESWRRLLDGIVPQRVLEVGCNVGWNLEYLRRLGASELYGVEPSAYAVDRARSRGAAFGILQGTAFELPFRDGWFDLVFTSGVLIHISPTTIGEALDEMYRVARRYIVAIEYDNPIEREVNYRGHAAALWKRDHGAAWVTRHPDLHRIRRLELNSVDGYDDCTAHLFEKR